MFVIREILNCRPGKVRQMVDKFKTISSAVQKLGHEPMRVLTDVAGEPFWTVIAEVRVDTIDQFFAVEQKLMGDEAVRKAMADYHELVESGRREIYRIEA